MTMAADGKSNGADATTTTKPHPKSDHDNDNNDDEARLKEMLIKKKVMQKVKNRRESGHAAAAADTATAADTAAAVAGPTLTENNDKSKTGELEHTHHKSGVDEEDTNQIGEHGDNNDRRDKKSSHHHHHHRHHRDHHDSSRSSRRADDRDRGSERGGPNPSRGNDMRGGGGGGSRDGPFPRGGGEGRMMDSRDYYRGDYRGDSSYGPPPPYNRRDYYDDRRGGHNGGRGWRGGGAAASMRPYADRYDGPGPRGGGGRPMGGRRDERERDIYGRNAGPPSSPPPLPQRGSAGSRGEKPDSKGDRSHSISSRGSYSRSPSRSRSNSTKSDRSRSRSRDSYSRSSHSRSSSSRSVSRSYSRSPSRESTKRKRGAVSSSHHSHDKKRRKGHRRSRSTSPHSAAVEELAPVDDATKDQRTIFVSQLVMRAEERDISRYFKRTIGIKVRDVILLRDRRTGRHKGCAYVELGTLEDVDRALMASGKTPDFQRFPILVKRTEAEKNGVMTTTTTTMAAAAGLQFTPPVASTPHQFTADGRRIEAQKVYIGSIDPCVTQAQLYALFSQFGPLEKVLLQIDVATGMSRGFAFLSYRDPKDANLAIQTMSGQMLVGRPLKTGWANQQVSAAGVVEVKSDEFPDDANEKIQKVNGVLTQLTGTSLTTMIGQVDPAAHQALLAAGPAGALGIMPSAQLANVANAALDMALGVAPAPTHTPAATATAVVEDAKVVGRSHQPTQHILVHNMFNKDEETDPGWENDIKLDFEEECAQYGKITCVVVMSKDPGGMIYASFDSVDGASNCAKNLAGRWFDKRQLRVEFVDSVPDSS